MIVSAAIDGALGTLDRITKLASGTKAIFDDLITLRTQLLATKNENMALAEKNDALQKRVRELENAIARKEKFEIEAQKYELKDVGRNAFAYALKPDTGSGEPPHYLCVNCYADDRKSILQRVKVDWGFDVLACPRCGAQVQVVNDVKAEIMTVPRQTRAFWDED